MVAPNNGDNTNTNGAAPGTTPEAELAPDAMAASQKEQEFAELGDNPFPELAFDPDCLPEPVAAVDGHNAHDDVGSPLTPDGRGSLAAHDANSNNNAISHAAAIEPDASDNRGPAVVYAEPNRSWVAKHKAWVIVGVILTAIITIGVAVGVVLVEKAKHGGGGGGAGGDGATSTSLTRVPSSPVPSGSPRTSSTDTSATTTSTGSSSSSTATPSACTDTSDDWLTKISWMGIAAATGGWSVTYASTTSATSCCVYCYESTPRGCDAWAWIPDDSSGSTITACNIISGWNGTDADDTCPAGYTSVFFSQAGTNASHVGAPGPCATASSS